MSAPPEEPSIAGAAALGSFTIAHRRRLHEISAARHALRDRPPRRSASIPLRTQSLRQRSLDIGRTIRTPSAASGFADSGDSFNSLAHTQARTIMAAISEQLRIKWTRWQQAQE